MYRNLWEVAFFTAMVFWPYALAGLGLVAFRFRRRLPLAITGLLLIVPSLLHSFQIGLQGHSVDAWLFWVLPLTANLILGAIHLRRAIMAPN